MGPIKISKSGTSATIAAGEKIRTGLVQIVGQVQASVKDSQSKSWAKSHNSSRPCGGTHLEGEERANAAACGAQQLGARARLHVLKSCLNSET